MTPELCLPGGGGFDADSDNMNSFLLRSQSGGDSNIAIRESARGLIIWQVFSPVPTSENRCDVQQSSRHVVKGNLIAERMHAGALNGTSKL